MDALKGGGRRPGSQMHKAELEPKWVQGFTNRKVGFINNRTVCYPCGNYILFINMETRERSFLQCQFGSIGAFAVNASQNIVAFSDRQLNPRIYVHNFPGLKKIAKLKGQASLDYSLLAFSHTGPYLASYSSLPEFCLSIWDWQNKLLLCSKSQPEIEITAMSFNPMNWHQLCLFNGASVTLWSIERNNKEHILISKPVKLPIEDGSLTDEENSFFSHPNVSDHYFGPVLPNSAIAGLIGDEAEIFKPKDDIQPYVHPTVHCWTPDSELYLGCEEGYFLKIGADTYRAVLLTQKLSPDAIAQKRTTFRSLSHSSRKMEDEARKESQNVILLAMALHKDGLYAAGTDGFVRLYKIKGTSFQAEDCFEIEEPITTLFFSPDYIYLLVETEKGSLYIFNPNSNEDVIALLDASMSQFLAADFIVPGNKHCLSVAKSGEIQVWELDNGAFISTLCLHTVVTAMACSLSSHSAAIGTPKGRVFFIDLTNVETPRVIHRILLSENMPVQFLLYEQTGQFLIAASTDGSVFILNALPSTLFKVLGYVVLSGEIVDITSQYNEENELIEVIALLSPTVLKRARVEIFTLPLNIISDNEICITERGLLKDSIIQKHMYELEFPLLSLVKRKDETVIAYASQASYICKYHLTAKVTSKDQPILSEKKIPSKQFGQAFLCLSPHDKWLASAADSGLLIIRNASTLDVLTCEYCHSYNGRGIKSLAFSLDSQNILVTGTQDGALVCLKWKKIGERKMKDAVDFGTQLLIKLNNYIFSEKSFMKTMAEWAITSKPTYSISFETSSSQLHGKTSIEVTDEDEYYLLTEAKSEETSWLDQKAEKAIKDETDRFAEKRKELKHGIKALRKKIQEMMFDNSVAPKIEKLDQQEFNLDVEEQEKQQTHSASELERVRKDIEMENLANSYLREMIKRECWDTMLVKGRSIKTFHSSSEVQNYPMKERSPEEKQMLERVLYLKKIESIDMKLRKKIVEFDAQPSVVKEEGEKTEEEEEKKIDALVGSLSAMYGGNTSLLYNQLELHTREEKISQIILLRDIIYNVKSAFNKDFDSVARMKELEISRVKEKNIRISQILNQLDIKEEIWVPTLTDNEKPDRALVVQESEIKVEMYLTPVQKAKNKIMSRIEYKRRLAAQGDNARERGLIDMMNGVLEIKKEDILKMEIPPPPFASKEETLWSEEEKKIYKEYEKKVKELNEEREKHRKILETELRKLQGSIQETTQGFDEILNRLFDKKVHCEMVIYQEELKITNLIFSLLLDEELTSREAALHHHLNKKRKEKVISSEAVKAAKTEVDAFREAYDILIAEDKVMERGFRKEFSDLQTHYIDQLFKLYKRRPRALKMKVQTDTANPYGERPGSAKMYQDALAHLMKAIDEMDHPENRPEGLDIINWERFCTARRAKVESEQQVKQKALTLAEMQTYLQKRIEDDEQLRKDIDHVFAEINLLREQKMRFQLDLMVQFLFKQGQVELEGTHLIPDYTDAILINRTIIEELNSMIWAQGEKKIASMVESKDFRKGIFQLEWEHRKMQMQVNDLNQKARDIQKLNVTKDHQIFLSVLNYDKRMNHEVSIMEGTFNFLDKIHKKNIEQKEKIIKELEKQIHLREVANQKLSKKLQEMLVLVSERRHIYEATDSELLNQNIAKEHYEDIVQRQQLVDLAKAQAQELAILQAEVERLRMRTFPAFFDVQQF